MLNLILKCRTIFKMASRLKVLKAHLSKSKHMCFAPLRSLTIEAKRTKQIRPNIYLSSNDHGLLEQFSDLGPINQQYIPPTDVTSGKKSGNSTQRPLMLLFEYTGAERRHINKYVELYLSLGLDVITVQKSIEMLVTPHLEETCVKSLLKILTETQTFHRPFLVKTMSGGVTLYSLMLSKFKKDPQIWSNISSRFVGGVFDSVGTYQDVPHGYALMSFPNNTVARAMTKTYLHMKMIFVPSYRAYYTEKTRLFRENYLNLPSLLLYSKNDQMMSPQFVDETIPLWQQRGIDVTYKCWDKSPHVGHLNTHPMEYREFVSRFVQKCLSSS